MSLPVRKMLTSPFYGAALTTSTGDAPKSSGGAHARQLNGDSRRGVGNLPSTRHNPSQDAMVPIPPRPESLSPATTGSWLHSLVDGEAKEGIDIYTRTGQLEPDGVVRLRSRVDPAKTLIQLRAADLWPGPRAHAPPVFGGQTVEPDSVASGGNGWWLRRTSRFRMQRSSERFSNSVVHAHGRLEGKKWNEKKKVRPAGSSFLYFLFSLYFHCFKIQLRFWSLNSKQNATPTKYQYDVHKFIRFLIFLIELITWSRKFYMVNKQGNTLHAILYPFLFILNISKFKFLFWIQI
jgi:hypothetical protein